MIQNKKFVRRINRNKGFTLIEILVVIGIIAVLAAVVIVAINPARQFKLARDSQRLSNVTAILNAIGQNIAEHKGTLYCGDMPATTVLTVNKMKMSSKSGDYDIYTCVVPKYISAIPFDPSSPDAKYSSPIDYDTQYFISQDSDGRITIDANGELSTISVTR